MRTQHDMDLLNKAVESATNPVFMSTRSAIVTHYQDTYGTAWKSHIVNDLMKASPDAKRASVAREFQFDKRVGAERYKSTRVSAATQEKYTKLGKELPPVSRQLKAGQDSITVTVKGEQQTGRGSTRDKTVEITLSGSDAYKFVNEPTYADIWEAYDVDPELFDDGDYELAVGGVYAS